MSEKVIGYFLVLAGILTILFSAYSVHSVFTGKKDPVELFKFGPVSINVGKDIPGQNLQQEFISSEMINKPLNLFAHLMLMGFIAGAGYKIASLGIKFIRPIVVKTREKPISS